MPGLCVPCHPQEKQKASQQQIEELSEKVNALMLEKQQLERALERANSNNAQVRNLVCRGSTYSSDSSLGRSEDAPVTLHWAERRCTCRVN